MERSMLEKHIRETFEKTCGNGYKNMPYFDAPIFGIGSASDPLFDDYKDPSAIGPWFMKPDDWLPEAKTVIAIFFPLSKDIRDSNRGKRIVASVPWAHARIEGQKYISDFTHRLMALLNDEGFKCVYPQYDPRFEAVRAGKGITGYEGIDKNTFGSRWSERHAAYVCGLGTFSLSKGLITEKGIAGRFSTIITDAYIKPDERSYTGIYDYCINCGQCIKKCPSKAIDIIHGKDHNLCFGRMKISGVIRYPRYGCGLCQVDVPCETKIPF